MSGAGTVQFCSDLLRGLLDLVYPPHCLLCGTFGDFEICDPCIAQLIVPVPSPYCLRCGQIQPGAECLKCVDYPAMLLRCRSVGVYDGNLAEAIHKLKYQDRPMLAKPLSRIMADYLKVRSEIMGGLQFDSVVPVPLHNLRERHRGYNQSERLARGIASELGLRLDTKALVRTRRTRPQVGQHRSKRLVNLKGAFRADTVQCAGKTLLLVDDVSTTGSTISECARALIAAGANAVYAISLAAS